MRTSLLIGIALTLMGGINTANGQLPQSESASIELIVRPSEHASSTLHQRLQGALPKAEGGPLFQDVESIRSTFHDLFSDSKDVRATSDHIPAYTLTVRDSASLSTLESRWNEHSEVEYAHPNIEYSVEGENSFSIEGPSSGPHLSQDNIFADSLDHLGVIRALEGWSITAGREDVRIGVVDTGIFLEHPDLTDQFWINQVEDITGNDAFDEGDRDGTDADGNGFVDDVVGYDFVDRPNAIIAGDYQDRDPDPSPDPEGHRSGHGTEVAGILSAAADDPTAGMVGVAPETQLVALRAFGGDGRGQTDDIAAAILYGATMGVDVLNLSFGRHRSAPLLEEVIQFALDQGTVVVASAGNQATDEPHYPSDYPEVLSVVWLAEDGESLPEFSRSQYGIGVDLGAPGSNVFTTQYPAQRLREGISPRREDLYGSVSGSSFSAPQVAGAASLLRAADSSLSPASIRSILTGTAGDLQGTSWDHTTGAGRVDVARGLSRVLPAQTEIHHPQHNQGIQEENRVPVIGTTLDPSFQEYALYFAEGTQNFNTRPNPWKMISGPASIQVHQDTLGSWNVSSLSEGEYTLRLVTTLQDGRTIEDRRRVVIDRSPPEAEAHFFGTGRVEGEWGIVADIQSDDVVGGTMKVQMNGRTFTVDSEYETARQGLFWSDERGRGGAADVQITLTNRSDLKTTLERRVSVPPDETNSAFFVREETSVPQGRLLPLPTDFDEDGLREIVLNQYQEGGLSDTVRSFEWTPSGFTSMDTLEARMIPKDVGDTNRDGRKELLLQAGTQTLLMEQSDSRSLPSSPIDILSSERTEDPFIGTRLTNVDRDDRGEVLGNTQTHWRLLEREGLTFRELTTLENPTSASDQDRIQSSNAFGTAEAETADFDGDGREDLLVGDRDGDLIIYETTEGGGMEAVWKYETDRVDAGNRFGVGDVTGDGELEFITFSTYYPLPLEHGVYEPPLSFYSLWKARGDDTYERIYRLPVAGQRSNQGSIATADFTGNGREEIAIAHPPSLLVLGADSQGDIQVLHEDRERPSVLSRSMVAADIDGNGWSSLLAATTDETLAQYVVNQTSLNHPPPSWTVSRPLGESSTQLSWTAAGADSVTVFAGGPNETLNPILVETDSTATLDGSAERRFALRAWKDGTGSPLSEERIVRPHAPATVTKIDYPDPTAVRIQFTEPLFRPVRPDQFELESFGSPGEVIHTNGGHALVLRFDKDVRGKQALLSWHNLLDASGLPVAGTEVEVAFPQKAPRTLFIEEATILSEKRVRLQFNEPLNREEARDLSRYTVRPDGMVVNATTEDETPRTVTLHLDGIVAGATGREVSLSVSSMQSANGHRLVKEGSSVRLTQPADDLSEVFLYPNPVRRSQHGEEITVAGLPQNATVRIYSPEGRLVRVLSVEDGRTGGTTWDLRDRKGTHVPSGVYLVRVEAADDSPVLKKVAVIR